MLQDQIAAHAWAINHLDAVRCGADVGIRLAQVVRRLAPPAGRLVQQAAAEGRNPTKRV